MDEVARRAFFLAPALCFISVTASYLINPLPSKPENPLLSHIHSAFLCLSFFMALILAGIAIAGSERFLKRYAIACLVLLAVVFSTRLCLVNPICDDFSSIRIPDVIFPAGVILIPLGLHLYHLPIPCCRFLRALVYKAFMTMIAGAHKLFMTKILRALNPPKLLSMINKV